MKSNILILANEVRFINKFLHPSIETLLYLDYTILLVSNVPVTQEIDLDSINNIYLKTGHVVFQKINIPRSPFKLIKLIRSIRELHKLILDNNIELIHVHTPTAAIVARLANLLISEIDLKIIYSAHGFHFYKNSSIFSWLVYYPIEKTMSRFTDLIITTNNQDYDLASKNFFCNVKKINGVGLNFSKFQNLKAKIKTSSGLNLISIGELNKNKNHVLVIKALSKIKDIDWYYTILGDGPLRIDYQNLVRKLNLEDRIFIKGYSDDVLNELASNEVFIHPSFREGLSVALMEAMYSCDLIIASRIRGNEDLIEDNQGGLLFDSNSEDQLIEAIYKAHQLSTLDESFVSFNRNKLTAFSSEEIKKNLLDVYSQFKLEQKDSGIRF